MNEEIVLDATRTAHGYLVSQLSEHIHETPEGFLVVVGCPVARTGFQEYSTRDLPQESAAELGVDISQQSAMIDLYRPAREVFDPEFIASLEGKPVTDNHPPGFVTPENFHQYAKGHIQNVRKGDEQLADGEWPLVADLVISGEPLVSKVRNKQAREISLGYDYAVDRDGNKIIQCAMRGNHCAVVPSGRAGDLVSIGDQAPPAAEESPPLQVQQAAAPPPEQGPAPTATAPLTRQEKRPMNLLKHVFGLGVRAAAQDSEIEPEKLAEVAADFHTAHKARDAEEDEEEMMDKKAKDRKKKSKDAEDPTLKEPEDEDHEPAADAAHRKSMHDALDDFLDQQEGGNLVKDKRKATDADLDELKSLLSQFFSEEEQEPEHAAVDTTELDEALGGAPPMEEEEEEESMDQACPCGDPGCPGCEAKDMEETVESGEEELEPVMDRAKAADRSAGRAGAADGAKAVLKMLRPVVARTGDALVVNAFNAALASVSRSSKASIGGYGQFAGAARTRSRAADKAGRDPIAERNARLQAAYDASLKEGK